MSDRTLRELVGMIEGVLRAAQDEDIPEDAIADTLEGLDWNLTEKTDAIASYLRSCDEKASACREEAKRISARARMHENRKERLRAYAGFWLARLNHKSVETALNRLSLAKGQDKVVIDNEAELPEECIRIKREPDRVFIKSELRAGKDVPGAHLEEGKPVVRLA